MKRVLKKLNFRAKCPYCDCEFEYDYSETFRSNLMEGSFVTCPRCHNVLAHKESSKSNITTEQL